MKMFPLSGNGELHPPFSFRLRRKENGPCTVQKKSRWGPNLRPQRAQVWASTGVPERDCRADLQSKRWARSSSSQSPYPSLPAYAESSLIPMLVLSPRKPLRWVFAGAPDLLKLSVLPPRRSASVRRGCKPDLTCFVSPLPLCRPRGGLGHFIDLARSVLVKYYNFQSM